MVNYLPRAENLAAGARSEAALNAVFAALADPTRRRVLALLDRGAQPVSELARPFPMSLPGFMKHLDVLEDAGMLAREKQGRVVSCKLVAEPLRDAAEWLFRYRRFWEERLDALARYLAQEEAWIPRRKRSPRSRSGGTTPPPRKSSTGRGRSPRR